MNTNFSNNMMLGLFTAPLSVLQGYKSGTLTKEWVKENLPLLGVPFTVKETIAVAGG